MGLRGPDYYLPFMFELCCLWMWEVSRRLWLLSYGLLKR